MSETFEKGARVAIVSGRQGLGMRGEVFWIGESRYGKGARYGVRGDDGETYWVDGQHVGPEDAVPPPKLPERDQAPLAKGTRVRITRGESAGAEGEVFWVGERKFGPGHRYGVRDDEGETHWIDGPGVEAIQGAPPPKSAPAAKRDAREFADDAPSSGFDDAASSGFDDAASSGFDDAPLPGDDELAYGENDFDDEEPPF